MIYTYIVCLGYLQRIIITHFLFCLHLEVFIKISHILCGFKGDRNEIKNNFGVSR
mgnify:CR=1